MKILATFTTEEACKKWCVVGMWTNHELVKCAANECMAWRWAEGSIRISTGDPAPESLGYCGIAGSP